MPKRPALLFLHGFLGEASDWRPVTAALSKRYDCLAVDLPGHGKAPFPRGSFSSCAREIAFRALRHFRRPFSVVGYSMGGRLALYMALRFPALVKALVLESASPGHATAAQRRRRRREDGKTARRMMREGLTKFLDGWYAQPLFSSLKMRHTLLKNLLRRRKSGRSAALAAALIALSAGAQPSLWKSLQKLPPTLLLTGEKDKKFLRIGRRMRRLNKSLRLGAIRGAGHNIHLEKPTTYLREVRLFLSLLEGE